MFIIRQITLVAEWNIRLSTDLQWLLLQFIVLSLWRREVINAHVWKAYTNATVGDYEFTTTWAISTVFNLMPLTDEQVFHEKLFYDKFTLPSVRVHAQQSFYDKFVFDKANLLVCIGLYKNILLMYNTPIANVLLGSIILFSLKVFFANRTDGQVFTFRIFSMTSALVEKLALRFERL